MWWLALVVGMGLVVGWVRAWLGTASSGLGVGNSSSCFLLLGCLLLVVLFIPKSVTFIWLNVFPTWENSVQLFSFLGLHSFVLGAGGGVFCSNFLFWEGVTGGGILCLGVE